jgi:uncharacterized protein (TIGR02118 family)
MFHCYQFIKRLPNLELKDFQRRWCDDQLSADELSRVIRHIKSCRLDGEIVKDNSDGVNEFWVESLSDFFGVRAKFDAQAQDLKGSRELIEHNRSEWLSTIDNVILDGALKAGQVKTVSRVRRKEGMSVEEFRDWWSVKHSEIACRLPGIERYVQSATVDEAYVYGEPRWDGVAQIWVRDLSSLTSMRESETYQVEAMNDAACFLDLSAISVFVAIEQEAC